MLRYRLLLAGTVMSHEGTVASATPWSFSPWGEVRPLFFGMVRFVCTYMIRYTVFSPPGRLIVSKLRQETRKKIAWYRYLYT